VKESPRKDFLYWNDDGQLTGVRLHHLNIIFLEQEHKGLGVWQGEFTSLRVPKVFNLRSDAFERADESVYQLETGKLFFVVPAQAVVAQWLETFKEFPPQQRPASFNIDAVMQKLTAPQGSASR